MAACLRAEARSTEPGHQPAARISAGCSLPSAIRAGIPPELDAIVLKAIARDPGERYPTANALADEMLGTALGLQALMDVPMTAAELGTAIVAWHLGARLPDELLKLRLDSLTAILGQPPLAYALSRLDTAAQTARPWRSAR